MFILLGLVLIFISDTSSFRTLLHAGFNYNIYIEFNISHTTHGLNNIYFIYIYIYIFKYCYHLIDIVLMIYLINTYRRLFNFGAETIQRDFDVERTFH